MSVYLSPHRDAARPLSQRIERSLRTWRARLAALSFALAALGGGWVLASTLLSESDVRSRHDTPGWSADAVSQTMSRARRIIRACYDYRDDHGRFPNDLDDLRPNYLGLIEPPATGNKRWAYFTYNRGEAMYLSFAANERFTPARSYASQRSPAWARDGLSEQASTDPRRP